MSNPVEIITGTWRAVAPTGYGGNTHALVQAEFEFNGKRGILFPALVFSSAGVEPGPTSPDGRTPQLVEEFQLDFRAATYTEARRLAEAFRLAVPDSAVRWAYLADDVGVDLVLATTGALGARRVAQLALPFG